MKKLIENCEHGGYIYLKTESIPITNPSLRVVSKEIYACSDCGLGLDVYDLDNVIEMEEKNDV